MPTPKQKALANNMALDLQEHRFKRLQDLLMASGYSELVAKHDAKEMIQRKGVQEVLEKLGFNEIAAKAAVSEILLLGSESNRLRAVQEVFKVMGSYAPEKHLGIALHGNLGTIVDRLDKYEKVSENNPSQST